MTGPGFALVGDVALVTGGGSGIGRAVVDRYVAEGADVVVLDRDEQGCEGVRRDHPRAGVVHGDATDVATVQLAVETAVSRFGKLDVLVSNAGVYDLHRTLRSLAPDELSLAFDQLFAVNVKAALLAARCALEPLRESHGSMIFTVSPAGFQAACGGPLYTASKHALVGVIRQLAYELAPTVRVNGVAPGATRTNLRGVDALHGEAAPSVAADGEAIAVAATPLGFVAEPEDHAGAYVLLASRRDGRAMTATVLRTDGGMEVRVRPRRAGATEATARAGS